MYILILFFFKKRKKKKKAIKLVNMLYKLHLNFMKNDEFEKKDFFPWSSHIVCCKQKS